MKKRIYTILSAVLISGCLTISCKKEVAADSPTEFAPDGSANVRMQDTTEVEGGGEGTNSSGSDASGSYEGNDGNENRNGNGNAANTVNTKSNLNQDGATTTGSTLSTTTNRKKKQTGTTEADKYPGKYSAPDGTNAENHDGDYYTRNNTQQMPTGSIK